MYKIKPNPNKEEYNEISQAIMDNDGYCCCALEKKDDTLCMCKAFRDQAEVGFCHCGRYYKVPDCPIVTLCGSTRFKDDFLRMQSIYTLAGFIVLSVGCFGHADNIELSEEDKHKLDELHKVKIAMADLVFIVNKDGYIGESTQSEIEWAEELGKKIIYMEEKGE